MKPYTTDEFLRKAIVSCESEYKFVLACKHWLEGAYELALTTANVTRQPAW